MADETSIRPDSSLVEAIEASSGQKPSRCFHCRKCTLGCPLTFAMDVMPNQVMRMVQLGLHEEVLRSKTIWICSSCQTCTTRCPNDIDIAHLMDCLRQLSRQAGGAVAEENILKFHEIFLDSVRRHGRAFELGMVARYKLGAGGLFDDVKLGLEMAKRGKLPIWPDNIKGKREIRRMFEREKEG